MGYQWVSTHPNLVTMDENILNAASNALIIMSVLTNICFKILTAIAHQQHKLQVQMIKSEKS